jgi:ER lumen protein retaining receptor
MLQRTGEAETITTHYLAALGLYRGLYIPNWIYRYVLGTIIRLRVAHVSAVRYFTEGVVDPIAVTAGLIQTGLYADFFYIYVTKCVVFSFHILLPLLIFNIARVLRGEKFELPA